MQNNRTLKALKIGTSAVALVWVLSGCGGRNDDERPATEEVPATANETVSGFVGYLKRLVASGETDAEPVDISQVNAPTSETDEPDSVD